PCERRGMRLLGVRPRPAPDQADAARARVSALQGRHGWVPQVPEEAAGAGRHRRPQGSAASDRLPLPVRALAAGLPAGVRAGQFGLRPSHAAVVALTLLLGLAVAALLTGLGRPRVSA